MAGGGGGGVKAEEEEEEEGLPGGARGRGEEAAVRQGRTQTHSDPSFADCGICQGLIVPYFLLNWTNKGQA